MLSSIAASTVEYLTETGGGRRGADGNTSFGAALKPCSLALAPGGAADLASGGN